MAWHTDTAAHVKKGNMNAFFLFIPTRTPAGKEMLCVTGWSSDLSLPTRLPRLEAQWLWWRKKLCYWDLQQQVLLRILTVFQIIHWGANPAGTGNGREGKQIIPINPLHHAYLSIRLFAMFSQTIKKTLAEIRKCLIFR